MTLKIEIIILNPDEMLFVPQLSNGWYSDNLAVMPKLKEQLKDLGLIEIEDYTVVKNITYINNYQIKFSGRSLVVRALWTIPEDMFNLSETSSCSLASFNKAKLTYAATLPQKLCYVPDQKFRQKAFDEFYLYIQTEIIKVHVAESKPTTIMQKLDQDMAFVDKLGITNNWTDTPRSHLALVCLVKAYKDELAKPTLCEGGLSSIFKKTSRLAPLYKKILNHIYTIQNSDFDKISDYLSTQYDELIAIPQKKISSAANTTVNSAASASIDAKK